MEKCCSAQPPKSPEGGHVKTQPLLFEVYNKNGVAEM